MLRHCKRLTALIAALAIGAPTASAQEWNFSIGKKTKHGHVSVDFGTRNRRPYRRFGRDHNPRRVHLGHRHRHGDACYSRGGYYENRPYEVWVPGDYRRVWVPAEYDYYIDECGVTRRQVIRAAHYETIQNPGYNQTRYRRAWVPRRLICSR